MNILLPKLERIVSIEQGNKNSITQLIAPETEIALNSIHEKAPILIIEEFGVKYCFTSKIDNFPSDVVYILLTNVIPTKKRFENNEITIKKWLKHPLLLNYTPNDVISSWKDDFFYKEEDTPNNISGLRQPQIAALHMLVGHLSIPLDTATIVMPTGTGKTETMLSTLIAKQCSKLLITVPSDSLRDQISGKFKSLGLLKQFGVVGSKSLYPIVGVIKNKFNTIESLQHFIDSCNVIVTTMSWLTNQTSEVADLISNQCSDVFIDEAHHIKANSWNEFKNRFSKEKIVQFTATPFRNDGKRLDGKIIFNFPLRKAQEQGYYKKIEFIAVREYDPEKADAKIASQAVQRLREDIGNGYNHILMARCDTKQRAKDVYELYKNESDLNPVMIYSGAPNAKDVYQQILGREAKIIVCVDMLGEGFDLPELKIAAFHDIKKSLPITLQFAGRFTRSKYDENLGDASFIANIADLDVRDELADLYAADADWNEILSNSSYARISDEVEFKDFMDGFTKLNDSRIPFQNIMPKLSTVVFKNNTTAWNPNNFRAGIKGYEDFDFKFHDINRDKNILVIITGRKLEVEWVHFKDIYDIQWDIIIAYWDTRNNLLFINSSDNSNLYSELAEAILGGNCELIKGINVFRTFYNLKRVRLQNVGLRQFLGKNIRFRMMVGSDVADALSLAEKQRGEKAFVMGTGFEEGEKVNIGASYKGRIWTKLKGDLKMYMDWCLAQGEKLIDESIDPNQILRETLIPTLISEIPNVFPVWIDWDVDMYLETETKFNFVIDGRSFNLSNLGLSLCNPTSGGPILFALESDNQKVVYKLELLINKTDDGQNFEDFRIIQEGTNIVNVRFGNRSMTGVEFFTKFIPTIWFADGSALTGNEYVELKQSIGIFSKDNIISWDWTGTDLNSESQHVTPKISKSIQYRVIQELIAGDDDIVYDDDYSGEIADVVTIKLEPEKIRVKMYHLKYAHDGVVSNQIKNFYEVCGQAQKSIHWKHKSGKAFINHLLRRESKTRNGVSCSRLEKGTHGDLTKLLGILKNEISVVYEIYIVQPGLSKENASDAILTLLGVTETYMKEFSDIDLKVISSD